MRWVPWLTVLLLARLPAAELYRPAASDGPERLADGGFEAPASPWTGYQGGFTRQAGEGRNGSAAARCRRASDGDPARGVGQTIELRQREPQPIQVTLWSRAEAVTGPGGADYSLYVDLRHTDGSFGWGGTQPFEVGTHGWHRRRLFIQPTRPVQQLTVYGLFRKHQGTVWFDDASVHEVLTATGAVNLDDVAVLPADASTGTAERTDRCGPLALAWRDQTVTRVGLGDADWTGRRPGGFMVRDVAANSGFHSFAAGRCAALGLRLTTRVTVADTHLTIDGCLLDETARDRAVTLLFGLPVQIDGRRWGHDMRTAVPVRGDEPLSHARDIGCGANGKLSRYPLANLSGPAGDLNLAIDLRQPAQHRLGVGAGLFYLAFDFGLTPLRRACPGGAEFRILVYPSRGGFRGGLDRYYRLLPDCFRRRTPRQGTWMPFAKISQVPDWQDFGFRFKEGDDEVGWDDAHDILTFRYAIEAGTFWLPLPREVPRTAEAVLRHCQAMAANPQVPRRRWYQAALDAGAQSTDGRLQIGWQDAPWEQGGIVIALNPSPYLVGQETSATLTWDTARQAAYRPGARPELDGEYLDSLEGYATPPLNYRPEHLAAALVPPTFDLDDRRPVLHHGFCAWELARWTADNLHRRGRLTMANTLPLRFGALAAWFDVMGVERDWLPGGQWRPDTDEDLAYWRAMSAQRPYLLLQNTNHAAFGPYVERYLQRCLAYGIFPSMFSHNALDDHYFTKPAWYNRDRAAFRRWLPRIREVAEAGWQPLTGAACDNAAIGVERFGPEPTGSLYITLHNGTEQPQSGRLTGDASVLGRELPARAVTLQPGETAVIKAP